MGTGTISEVQCKYLFWKGKSWRQMLPTMICPQAGTQLRLDFRNAQILPKATPQALTVWDEFTIKESVLFLWFTHQYLCLIFMLFLAREHPETPCLSRWACCCTSQCMNIPEPNPKCNCWIQKQQKGKIISTASKNVRLQRPTGRTAWWFWITGKYLKICSELSLTPLH